MKKIEAVVRPEKLDDVLARLSGLSYPGVTITEVRGHGKQRGVKHMWRGAEYTVAYIPKVKIEVVVLDEDVAEVSWSIVQAARTDSIGDGKVFITEVVDAIRIRTGESGFKAI